MEHRVSENTNTESETDDNEVPNLMIEISRSLDKRTAGKLEVVVDGSVDTVEYNMPPDETEIKESVDDQNQDQPLEIDISGDREIIILFLSVLLNSMQLRQLLHSQLSAQS